MKTNRTYSIDVDVAKDLRQKHNQSQFVEDAIKAKLYPSGQRVALFDADAHTLLHRLLFFFEEDSMEWNLINNMWKAENKKRSIS
jgi:hypothetical protein